MKKTHKKITLFHSSPNLHNKPIYLLLLLSYHITQNCLHSLCLRQTLLNLFTLLLLLLKLFQYRLFHLFQLLYFLFQLLNVLLVLNVVLLNVLIGLFLDLLYLGYFTLPSFFILKLDSWWQV